MIKLWKDFTFWRAVIAAFSADLILGWLVYIFFARPFYSLLVLAFCPFFLAACVYQFFAPKENVFRAFFAGFAAFAILGLFVVARFSTIVRINSISEIIGSMFVAAFISVLGFLCTSIGIIVADVVKANLTRKLP